MLESLEPAALRHYSSGSVVIPTLCEALDFTREHDWLVNVEIKSFPERPRDSVGPILNVIAETQTASRVLISSFDHRDVAAADVAGREYALGILVMTPLYQTHRYAREVVGADTVHFSTDVVGSATVAYRLGRSAQLLEGDLVNELNRCGIPTLVYTVNDHGPGSLSEHLAAIGVAGIFTDDPRGLEVHRARN
jgi:glycerophosphoryl diester phosphodiesterase